MNTLVLATKLGQNLNNKVLVYLNNFFSKEEIAILYNDLKSSNQWNKRNGVEETYSQLHLSPNEVGIKNKFCSMLKNKTYKIHPHIMALYPSSISPFDADYLDFFKYETNAFVGLHKDIRNVYACKNFLSLIFYINDDYEGGLIKVYEKNKLILEASPSAGDVILLEQDMQHESTKVEKGNKYIAVHHWGYN